VVKLVEVVFEDKSFSLDADCCNKCDECYLHYYYKTMITTVGNTLFFLNLHKNNLVSVLLIKT
jgi:hypothetical protein